MKDFYLLKFKLKEFDKINQMNSNALSWNQIYILSQDLQYQVYKLEHYQKRFFIKNLEKIAKFSLIYEFNMIHLILTELTFETQTFLTPTKPLTSVEILNNKEVIKYWFFYFLNKKNNNLKNTLNLNEESPIFGNSRFNLEPFLFSKRNLKKNLLNVSSKKQLQKNDTNMNSTKLNKLNALKTNKRNFSLKTSFPKTGVHISTLKSDFLIKKLFYKHYFFNTVQAYFKSKIIFKHTLEKKFNNFNQSFFEALKKIFLSLYLQPKFGITLTLYLSRKTIPLWIHEILPNQTKNVSTKKTFFTDFNIKPIFSKKRNKWIYLQDFSTKNSLLNIEFNPKTFFLTNSIKIQQILNYVNIFTQGNTKEELILNQKECLNLLKKLSQVLNLKNFLKLKFLIRTNIIFTFYSTKFFLTYLKNNQISDLDSILNKELLKTLQLKNSRNLFPINSEVKSNQNYLFKQTFKPFAKINKRFFLLKSLCINLLFFSELKTFKKMGLTFYKFNALTSSEKMISNLTDHSKKKNEQNLLLCNHLTSYLKFLKSFFDSTFLKISKNHFFLNLFLIHFEKRYFNYFFSKLSNNVNNLCNQTILTEYMNLSFTNLFSNSNINHFLILFNFKLINKYDTLFASDQAFFLRSKKHFFRTFIKNYILDLFFIEFVSDFNKNYLLKFVKEAFLIPSSSRESFLKNFSNSQSVKRFRHFNFIGLDIMVNHTLFHSFLLKYQKLIFHNRLKLYQRLMKESIIFYGEKVLIFHKHYVFIETHKKNLLQLIYGFQLSVKQVKVSNSLLVLNQEIPGFIFYGFSIYQTLKKNKVQPSLNLRQMDSDFIDPLTSYKTPEMNFSALTNPHVNIVPSKTNVKNHLNQIKFLFFKGQGKDQKELIGKLSPKIHKWLNYYKIVSKKQIFNELNFLFIQLTWKWALKRHQNKNILWIKDKYFYSLNKVKHVFSIKNKQRLALKKSVNL